MPDVVGDRTVFQKPELLVVDDAVINIDILLNVLGEDYNVRVDTDGASALASAREYPPDLILLDIGMPGMDGFEVCRRLKSDSATRDIPVIFITGRNDDSDEEMGLRLGAVDYITKPFMPSIVKARICSHLELKKHRDHLEALVAERTRELAEANERLTSAGRLKDDFLRMISHEIRTPANGILGIGELIIDMCPESEECELFIEHFRKSGLRLINLIEDTTMIGEMEKVLLTSQTHVPFSSIINELRPMLGEKGVHLLQDGITEPVLLRGDYALLKSAMETLFRLALSFSIDKHSLSLKERIVHPGMVRLQFDLDDLSLSEKQAAEFFEIHSCSRSASFAEELGLAPVVAAKIISAFGGEIRLLKGGGKTGHLEADLCLGNANEHLFLKNECSG